MQVDRDTVIAWYAEAGFAVDKETAWYAGFDLTEALDRVACLAYEAALEQAARVAEADDFAGRPMQHAIAFAIRSLKEQPEQPDAVHQTTRAGEGSTGLTRDERKLRFLLCSAYAGALGYYDDGEAQDNRVFPFIDFMRDSPDDIQRKMWERNRNA